MKIATLDILRAKEQFSLLSERIKEEKLIWVTQNSKPAFALVDKGLMEAILETLEIVGDSHVLTMFQKSLEDIHAGRLIDHKEMKHHLY